MGHFSTVRLFKELFFVINYADVAQCGHFCYLFLYYIYMGLECCFFILPLIISNSEGTVECSCRLRTFSKALVEYPL